MSQLALSDRVPKGLSEVELADFIVRHVIPSASAPIPTLPPAAPSVPSSAAPPDRSSPPPPAALHAVASHDEVEELRKKLEEQEALNKKLAQAQVEQEEREKKREQELAVMRKQMQKLAPRDKEKDEAGGGNGLVLASSKSEVNAETVNTAAAQAVRPVQQQVVRVQHQLQEITDIMTDFIASHSDPVLKSHINKLTKFAIPVMKKHDDITGWQQRFVAVRGRWLCYGRSYDTALQLANSLPHHDASHKHVVNLAGCSVCEAPQHDDSDHCAFTLTALGGRSLLLSHRETACVVAIMETISRCSAPLAAADAALLGQQHSSDEDQRRLLLGKSDASRACGAQGEAEDFS